MEKLHKNSSLSLFLIIFISLTASFDIFMNVTIKGFSFRISQIACMLLIFLFVGWVAKNKTFKPFIGSLSLVIWTMFMVIFIPHTTLLTRNIGYAFWLILNVSMVFSMVQFVSNLDTLNKLLRWYAYSFLFVGLFGLLQFLLGVLHLHPPLVTQWWKGSIPRINGFSYEPSYYATYMLAGWVLVFYLCIEKIKILKTLKAQYILLFIVTLAMVLSSSRMGIILMGIWILRYVYLFLKYLISGYFHKKYAGILIVFLILAMSIVIWSLSDLSKVTYLLKGTGLNGTASYSVDDRLTHLVETIKVFGQNPILGVSLGGIPSAIGQLDGVKITSQEVAKQYEGQMIFAEVLAASGIIGFIPFVIFILSIILKPFKLAKFLDNDSRHILLALTFSLMALLLILQLNQNILRVYFWFHIGVLCSTYSVYKKEQNRISNYTKNVYNERPK